MLFGFKSAIVAALRDAFKENEFLDAIAGALADRIRSSAAVNSAVAEINRLIDRVDGVVNDNSPESYFARRLVMARLQRIAKQNQVVAQALTYKDTYASAVLDGITVNELLLASEPVGQLIEQKAIAIANDVLG